MRCEQPDRVPIQVRGVYPTRPDWMRRHHESYRALYEAVRDRCDPVHPMGLDNGWFGIDRQSVDIRVETHPVDEDWVEDVVTITTPGGPLTEVLRRSLKGEPGFQMIPPVNTVEDLERFLSIPVVPPKVEAAPFFEAAEGVGERALVIAEVGRNPVGMAHSLLNSENLAVWSLTEREHLMRLLRELRSRWEDVVRRILDAGVGPVLATLGHELALPPLLSPADFQEFVFEMDRPVMQMIREAGRLIHVHCHDKLNGVLEGFIELGVNCLHPVEAPPMGDVELTEAKRRLKGKVCIEGNIQIGEFMRATPSEIRETTRRIVEDAGEGGGLILCPTASPFWPTLSDRVRDNYLAFIDAGLDFGRY